MSKFNTRTGNRGALIYEKKETESSLNLLFPLFFFLFNHQKMALTLPLKLFLINETIET